MPLISRAAINLIVAEEVSSQAVYTKKYRRPEWPGHQSGVTIGIGYDIGYATPSRLRADWSGHIPESMIAALLPVCGVRGPSAKALTARLRPKVDVPWEAAMAVFENVDVPRWVATVRKALPNTEQLSPDCLGALVSLAYNRGASFSNRRKPDDAIDRYREMRAIKAHMVASNFEDIPAEFRAMKRIWPTSAGLRGRRDREAALFQKGLAATRSKPVALLDDAEPVTARQTSGDDRGVEPVAAEPSPLPAAPPPADAAVQGDPELWNVQRRLKAMNYNPGVMDGKWGGMTAGAISGFMNDRNMTLGAPTSFDMFNAVREELKAEIRRAESESPSFTRPVSVERANADAKQVAQIAPEVVPVKRNFLVTAWASFVTFCVAVWNGISGYISDAWNFFTEHKDDIPEGTTSTIWDMFGKVPGWVWLILVSSGFAVLAFNLRGIKNKITDQVQSGERP